MQINEWFNLLLLMEKVLDQFIHKYTCYDLNLEADF